MHTNGSPFASRSGDAPAAGPAEREIQTSVSGKILLRGGKRAVIFIAPIEDGKSHGVIRVTPRSAGYTGSVSKRILSDSCRSFNFQKG
jgi:hypothetical protein